MCYHNGIRVSFACRLCTEYFEKINDFIVHKKENHFQEFNYNTCIVFEEKITINSNDCVDQPTGYGYGLTPTTSTVQVKLEIPDDASLNLEQESAETEQCILVEPKFEQVIFESKSAEDKTPFNFKQEIESKPKPKCKNPYVRLKRLSCKKIQKFTKGSAYRDRRRHSKSHEPSFIENNSTYTDALQYQGQYQPTATRATAVNGNDSELRFRFECKLCLKSFNTDQQLRIHVQICLLYNNKSNLAYCVQCNSFFSNSQDLQVHSAFFHGHSIAVEINEQVTDTVPAPVSSSISKNCNRISNLTPIIASDAESNVAEEAFGRLDQLERILEDANIRPLAEYSVTETQDLTYTNFDIEVERHFNFNSRSDSNPFKCPEPNCLRSFKVQEGLTQHLKRHTGCGLFKCQVPDCGKSFIYEGTLYNHQIVHSDSFPFKCTYPSCDQAYKMKISLFKHLKTH